MLDLPNPISFQAALNVFHVIESICWTPFEEFFLGLNLDDTEMNPAQTRFWRAVMCPQILPAGLLVSRDKGLQTFPHTPTFCARQFGCVQAFAIFNWFGHAPSTRLHTEAEVKDFLDANLASFESFNHASFRPAKGLVVDGLLAWWESLFHKLHPIPEDFLIQTIFHSTDYVQGDPSHFLTPPVLPLNGSSSNVPKEVPKKVYPHCMVGTSGSMFSSYLDKSVCRALTYTPDSSDPSHDHIFEDGSETTFHSNDSSVPPSKVLRASNTSPGDKKGKSIELACTSDVISNLDSFLDQVHLVLQRPYSSSVEHNVPELIPGITMDLEELLNSPKLDDFFDAASQVANANFGQSDLFTPEQVKGIRKFLKKHWPNRFIFASIAKCTEQITVAKADLDEAIDQIHASASSLIDQKARTKELYEENSTLIAKINSLTQELVAAKAKLSSNLQRIADLENGIKGGQSSVQDYLQTRLLCAQNKLKELNKELSSYQQFRQSFTDGYCSLQRLLGAL